jgi:hypothetical protein
MPIGAMGVDHITFSGKEITDIYLYRTDHDNLVELLSFELVKASKSMVVDVDAHE